MIANVRLLLPWMLACCAWAQMPRPDFSNAIFKTDALAVSDPRAMEAFKAVRPGARFSKSDEMESANCSKVCPEYAAFQGEAPGLDVVAVTFGHFLSPESEDAVVSTEGCEPHSEGRGGTYLLTKRPGKWRLLWYKEGVITNSCHVALRRDRRQELLCENADAHQGNLDRVLYVEDLLAPKHIYSHDLGTIFAIQDTVNSCAGHVDGQPTIQPTIRASITRVGFTARGMTVFARFGEMNLTDEQIDDCDAGADPLPYDIPTKPYKIDFLFDGKTYHVAPWSRAAAEVFQR